VSPISSGLVTDFASNPGLRFCDKLKE